MGLFSKKQCLICGAKTGLISSRKIEGGKICGDCALKISPFYDDWKNTSAKKAEEMIRYNEENDALLDSFNPTKAYWDRSAIITRMFLIDENNRQFTVVQTPIEDFRNRKPEIFSFDMARDVYLEVDESWAEEDGAMALEKHSNVIQDDYDEVYWHYRFYLNVILDHPYIKSIRYQMNDQPVIIKFERRGLVFKRGLEISGIYSADRLDLLSEQLDDMAGDRIRLSKGLSDVFGYARNRSRVKLGAYIAKSTAEIRRIIIGK